MKISLKKKIKGIIISTKIMYKLISFLFLFISQVVSAQVEYDKVFNNVNIVTLDGIKILYGCSIGILDGKIASISNEKNKKLSGKIIFDLNGQYIMPSLSDAHVHFPETEAEMEHMLKFYILNGITKLRSMRGDWKHSKWKLKFNSPSSYFPKLYLSPPPISNKIEFSTEELENYVKTAKSNDFQFIKILGIKTERNFKDLDFFCKKYNLPIAGHFPRSEDIELKDDLIFGSNYNSIEHLDGLFREFTFINQRLIAIKQNKIFICPTLTWYSVGSGRYTVDELKSLPGIDFIHKTKVENWITKTKEYRNKIGDDAYKKEVAEELNKLNEKFEIVNKLHSIGIKMLLSPDSSSKYIIPGFSLVEEMKLLKHSKIDNIEILKMATTNFSDLFNGNYGKIEVGKDADFIVLNENPLFEMETLKNIKGICFNNFYLSSSQLEKLKSELLKEVNN